MVTSCVSEKSGDHSRLRLGGGCKTRTDANNRPVKFTSQGGTTTIHCGYDYMGRLFEKKVTVNGTITLHHRYLYRGYLQIVSLDAKRANMQDLWLIHWDPTQPTATRPLSIRKNGTWYTYGHDLTKNVMEVFNTSGGIATSYDYTPFGKITVQGTFEQPIQWSSEVYDEELALTYYNYRHYNPMDGRWINRDPIAEQGGINLYGFVGNGATFIKDYLGLEEYSTIKEAFAAAGKIVVEAMESNYEKEIEEWISLTKEERDRRFPGSRGCLPPCREFGVRICCKQAKYYVTLPKTAGMDRGFSSGVATPCKNGYKVVAIVHSHPTTDAKLSPQDCRAADRGFPYPSYLKVNPESRIPPKTLMGSAARLGNGLIDMRLYNPKTGNATQLPPLDTGLRDDKCGEKKIDIIRNIR